MGKPKGGKKSFERPEAKEEQHKRILIVSEGGKTEPSYFEALRKDLGLRSVNSLFYATGDRSSPMTVVKDAKKYLESNKDESFDEVFCVFDRDKHTDFYPAVNACKQETNPPFHAIASIICFEVWLLMHFSDNTKAYETYKSLEPDLKKLFKEKLGIKSYQKGMTGIFGLTKDRLSTAIKNAKSAEKQAVTAETDNPTTKIYQLVETMQKMARRK
jgi:hypothetical protein